MDSKLAKDRLWWFCGARLVLAEYEIAFPRIPSSISCWDKVHLLKEICMRLEHRSYSNVYYTMKRAPKTIANPGAHFHRPETHSG